MIDVVCAIIFKHKKVLVAQHNMHPIHLNKWEFPGGKIEEGETRLEAIVREIKEELDIEVSVLEELHPIKYSYPAKDIKLIPLICEITNGTIVLKQHLSYQWIEIDRVNEFDLCEADKEVIEKIPYNKEALSRYARENMNK